MTERKRKGAHTELCKSFSDSMQYTVTPRKNRREFVRAYDTVRNSNIRACYNAPQRPLIFDSHSLGVSSDFYESLGKTRYNEGWKRGKGSCHRDELRFDIATRTAFAPKIFHKLFIYLCFLISSEIFSYKNFIKLAKLLVTVTSSFPLLFIKNKMLIEFLIVYPIIYSTYKFYKLFCKFYKLFYKFYKLIV